MKTTIEVEAPAGYKAVAFRIARAGEYYIDEWGQANKCREDSSEWPVIVLEKLPPPKRRIFEQVSEEDRLPKKGEYRETKEGSLLYTDTDFEVSTFPVWREVNG